MRFMVDPHLINVATIIIIITIIFLALPLIWSALELTADNKVVSKDSESVSLLYKWVKDDLCIIGPCVVYFFTAS